MTRAISRRLFLQAAGVSGAVLALPTRIDATTAQTPLPGRPVNYELRAGPSRHRIAGVDLETSTYNGRFPGPLLRARVGDRITVDLVNDLPAPTTIHWHGVEVPATSDGSTISQEAVDPGETFRYEFDALTSSLFWYHPHIDTNEQVERGLYGALLIEDPDENRSLGVTPGDDHVLVLDDILMEDGGLAPPFPADPLANAVTHFNGRIGNVLLVNGEERPTIAVRNGRPQRLRLVNTANSRFMRLSFPAGQRVWRVGGDGGLVPSPLPVAPIGWLGDRSDPDPDLGVLLTPGERADLVWVPDGPNRVGWPYPGTTGPGATTMPCSGRTARS